MHKGAILDVRIVRSLRIAIHAGRTADSARRSARRLPTGNGERGDAMVTLASVFLVVIVRTIWPPLVAEANGLRGLRWSRDEPGFGLSGLLPGTVGARTQPVARSIARPGGCCQCDI